MGIHWRLFRLFASYIAISLALGCSSTPEVHCQTCVFGGFDAPKCTLPADPVEPHEIDFYASRGEVLGFEVENPSECFSSPSSTIQTVLYKQIPVRTKNQSFPSAEIGIHYDPLQQVSEACPGDKYWVEFRIPRNQTPGLYEIKLDKTYQIKIWQMLMPDVPTLPLLVEMTSWYAYLAHYRNTQPQPWNKQIPITQKYVKLLKEHRIDPYKHWVSVTDENIEKAIETSGKYFILPVFGHDTNTLTEGALTHSKKYADIAKSLGKEPIVYLWDEPDKSTKEGALVDRAKKVRSAIPTARIMVTTPYDQNLKNAGVDIFTPVFQHIGGSYPSSSDTLGAGADLWGYVSCLSHGCNYLSDSGEPDLGAIERPRIHPRAFFWVGDRLNTSTLLYYNSVEFYKKDKDPWLETLWDFSGNGDGTLIWAEGEDPLPSLRLKALLRGSQDMEYLKWARKAGIPIEHPVKDWKIWEKNWSHYDAIIKTIGEALDETAVEI